MAGVDRLLLSAPLAVQDLLAAARFAAQPLDDLNLASLLVSPLFGWSQDELLEAAFGGRKGRSGRNLRQQPATADRDAGRPARDARHGRLCDAARFLRDDPCPGRSTAGASCSSGSAPEARDPIEELLSVRARLRERAGPPRCRRFLDWFARGDVEIVRDPSGAARRGPGDDRARRRRACNRRCVDPRRRLRRSRPRAAACAAVRPTSRPSDPTDRRSRSSARARTSSPSRCARRSSARTGSTARSIGGCSTSP